MTIDQWIEDRSEQLLATLIHLAPAEEAAESARLENAVRDYLTADSPPNLLLAAIGYPAPGDTDRILDDSAYLDSLRRVWARNPPDAELLERAVTDLEVHRLLTVSGTISTDDLAFDGPAPVRLGARHRASYTLAAADDNTHRHVQAWADGRLIREGLSDGTVGVTVEVEPPDESAWARRGAGALVVRLTAADQAEPWRLLLILQAPASLVSEPSTRLVGQAVVGNVGALGRVDVSEPLPVAELSDADLAVVPDSVAGARGEWNTAWRRAAHQAGKSSPLYRGVQLGSRQG